jgi:hypothetical protein
MYMGMRAGAFKANISKGLKEKFEKSLKTYLLMKD